MLRIENLVKQYNNVTAVDNISFIVNKGEIFGLLGPNGAGKTTTIRTILNILKPSSGKITYNGTEISDAYYNKIGYLPEERGLYRKSRCIDVITYFGRLKGLSSKETSKKSSEWLEKLGLSDQKYRKIDELSKGNQQKIQFIIAVIHDPEVLVLDEPFSGFDPINQELIAAEILRFKKEGKIIIISTHQMETAERLCSELLLLNKGKEVYCGNLRKLKQRHHKNNIIIDFSGDPSQLISFPKLRNLQVQENHAEFELPDEISPPEFLRTISNKMNVTSFYSAEPSLHKIFIDLITKGGSN